MSCSVDMVFKDPKSATPKNAEFSKAPNGYMIVNDKDGNMSVTYSIKYLKTTRDEDGTTDWYVIVDHNEKFNVATVIYWKKAIQFKSKSYKTAIQFQKRDSQGNTFDSIGFMCNKRS